MLLLKNCNVVNDDDSFDKVDILVKDGIIEKIGKDLDIECETRDFSGLLITPGFIDLHVHLREPGFTMKETIKTGTRAAAAGGFTTIFAMPNTNPVPDTPERMKANIESAKKDSIVNTYFYSAITEGESGKNLVDFTGMIKAGSEWFTDDGRGVQGASMMNEAMEEVAKLGGVIAAHCEDNDLLNKGYIHKGSYSKDKGHRGISRSVEDVQVARDILMAGDTGCRYHICHMSTYRGVDLLREGIKWGYKVSGEVTPHHLLLSEKDLAEDGNFKMNPPLREEKDRLALIEGLNDGTIKAVATDHAPHTESEKSRGLELSAFGITGLETAFPLLYTHLVKPGTIKLSTLVNALTKGPADIFGLNTGELKEGMPADITAIDLNDGFTMDKDKHQSMGRNTPFHGWKSDCSIKHVLLKGKFIVEDKIVAEAVHGE